MAEAAARIDFLYRGKDRHGRTVKGQMAATNAAIVNQQLRSRGIQPIRVKKKPKDLFGGAGKKITSKDISVFSRQMSTMMDSGVPLVQSFDIVGRGHDNPKMANLVMGIKADIEQGTNLSDALAKHPLHFNDLFVNLVRAGERGGILDDLLDKIATYQEKTESLKAKIKKALFYPVAVIVMAFLISAILLIFVIPQFAQLFSDFGADLPAPTKIVMRLSDIFVQWWWAIFGGIGAAVYSFLELKKRSRPVRQVLDRIALKMPIFGDLVEKAAIARFARTLSTMFAAGVPLVEAMESVAGATGNIVFYNGCMQMRQDVAEGNQLQIAVRDTQLFPSMVVQMVAIGEESGSLDSMLGKVADMYDEEVDNAVDALTSLMEPLIMAVLGVLIGGMVIAMYLPIFKMGDVV